MSENKKIGIFGYTTLHFPFFISFKKSIELMKTQKLLAKNNWNFGKDRTLMLINEFNDWEKNYNPICMKDKIVLDVGAGKGESAFFFLKKGAKKVIAIEPQREHFNYLVENSLYHNILPIKKYFDIEDLFKLKYDIAKIDIEGWEEMILNITPPKPLIIEVHGNQLLQKFIQKGYTYKKLNDIATCCNYVYWGIKP